MKIIKDSSISKAINLISIVEGREIVIECYVDDIFFEHFIYFKRNKVNKYKYFLSKGDKSGTYFTENGVYFYIKQRYDRIQFKTINYNIYKYTNLTKLVYYNLI